MKDWIEQRIKEARAERVAKFQTGTPYHDNPLIRIQVLAQQFKALDREWQRTVEELKGLKEGEWKKLWGGDDNSSGC
jgi:predicted mannosyl-3-phosphoglycerate phosphatase (HAD superfamily)